MDITEKDLTPEQKEVFDSIIKWNSDYTNPLLKVGGVAGSGKSVLISLVAKKLKSRQIAFCAFTGKAANVLKQKLNASGVYSSYCGTIHGLMYTPITDPKTLKVIGWKKKFKIDEDLIIVDEGSMVGGKLFKDLQSYRKKILVVGDHEQLSPVEGEIHLMKNPDLKLTQIHRVAADNPIIILSTLIRGGEDYSNFQCDDDRIKYVKFGSSELEECIYNAFGDPEKRLDSSMLCYYNRSRVRYNNVCRQIIGYNTDDDPHKDEVVICLKNTNIDDKFVIFNGMRGLVKRCSDYDDNRYDMGIDFVDDKLEIDELVSQHQFNQEKTFTTPLELQRLGYSVNNWGKVGMLFDYGYCLSYHKSQASQYNNVILFIERSKYQDNKEHSRAIYTAVTRSSQNLIIVK